MNRFYASGVQAALEKLGFRAIGRLPAAAIEEGTYETIKRVLKELPSKANKLRKIPPGELEKKKFLASSLGPW